MLVQVDIPVNCDLYFFRTLNTSLPLYFYIILGISDYLITIVMYNTTLFLKLDWNIILNCFSSRIRSVRLSFSFTDRTTKNNQHIFETILKKSNNKTISKDFQAYSETSLTDFSRLNRVVITVEQRLLTFFKSIVFVYIYLLFISYEGFSSYNKTFLKNLHLHLSLIDYLLNRETNLIIMKNNEISANRRYEGRYISKQQISWKRWIFETQLLKKSSNKVIACSVCLHIAYKE